MKVLRKAALLIVASVAGWYAVAVATVPEPTNCTVPSQVKVGGYSSGGVPDPSAAYTVVVRDALNAPIGFSTVELDFGSCLDAFVCSSAPGQFCSGGARAVTGVTNGVGSVTIYATGAANNSGNFVPPQMAPGGAAGCVRIYASGRLIGNATATFYDLNGKVSSPTGVNGGDLSVLKTDQGAFGLACGGNPDCYRGRSDYNNDGQINGLDRSFLIENLGCSGLGGCSFTGCGGGQAAYCP